MTTNNLSTSNVESIEVISGIPSVEYGDVGSGIVKISTKKGKTPYMVTFSSNPNTKQVSASKGFGIGKKAGLGCPSYQSCRSREHGAPHQSR